MPMVYLACVEKGQPPALRRILKKAKGLAEYKVVDGTGAKKQVVLNCLDYMKKITFLVCEKRPGIRPLSETPAMKANVASVKAASQQSAEYLLMSALGRSLLHGKGGGKADLRRPREA